MTTPTPPTPGEVTQAIQETVDADYDDEIQFVMPTGNDDDCWYYLVGATASWDEGDLLKLRYFQLPKPDSDLSSTMKKNGITMRGGAQLAQALVKGFARMANGIDENWDDPLWIDPDDH